MPGKAGPTDRLIERALTALGRSLGAAGAPWMVIGGIAVIIRGVRRFTSDIDAVVRSDGELDELLAHLSRERISSRVPKANEFARRNLVLLLRHDPTGVDLDLSLASSQFEQRALASRRSARFGRASVPVAAPADLVVMKAIAGRPQDLADIEALLVMYPRLDVRKVRRDIACLAEMADAPELVEQFGAVLTRARRGKK